MSTLPVVGATIPAIARRRVVFPEPFWPRITNASPGLTLAVVGGNNLVPATVTHTSVSSINLTSLHLPCDHALERGSKGWRNLEYTDPPDLGSGPSLCANGVAPARLKARPTATLCIDCAQRAARP